MKKRPDAALARVRVAAAARGLLDGDIGLVEAARLISAWGPRTGDLDVAYLVFAGIAEETDRLPDGRSGDRLLYEEGNGRAGREAACRLLKVYEPKSVTTDNH